MTLLDRFQLLMHGVQATRRYVERLACPMQGASGVRAQFYPHQFQNVQRILTASEIRHLIADEVGMGKTVEALMVAHAVRLQRGRLRVCVLVGRAELKTQWHDEIVARAHGETIGKSGGDWYQIHTDNSISQPSEQLAPGNFDMLIIDEPQSLRAELLGYIAEHAAEYSRLLLLTASPNLRVVRRLCELLQMIEPERIERVRRELHAGSQETDEGWSRSRLRDIDEEELQNIYAHFLQRTSYNSQASDEEPPTAGVSQQYSQFSEVRKARVLAATRWKYRNVLRAQRRGFPRHLPRRKLTTLVARPTAAERTRMEIARKMLQTSEKPAAAAFLRRMSLGGDSLQQRLRRRSVTDQPFDSEFLEIGELSGKQHADSRLDALVDWLTGFWRHDPKRKVVIAAQDTPTVRELESELRWRIPTIGPRGWPRHPLGIVTAVEREASAQEALEDEEDDDTNEFDQAAEELKELYDNSQLRPFAEPDNQLLIAHDRFRQSYNLQIASAIVFYSLPWKPEDLDQWIGRVDRLGRNVIDPEKRNSPPTPVRIVTLHREGDPTLAVEEVFQRYALFESALDPERGILQQITQDVHAVAVQAGEIAQQEPGTGWEQAAETAPPPGSPWTPEKAVESFYAFLDREIPGPILRRTPKLGYTPTEEEKALASWVKLLSLHQLISTRRKSSGPGRTCGYFTLGHPKAAEVKIDSLAEGKSDFPAFFMARSNTQRPPRWTVVTGKRKNGEDRIVPLQFLSHGSPLHEELISTYRHAGSTTVPFAIRILSLGQRYYPDGTELVPGDYVAGAGTVDSGCKYSGLQVEQKLLDPEETEPGKLQAEMRRIEVEKVCAQIESDQRFVRISAPASLFYPGMYSHGGENRICKPQVVADLLTAHWEDNPKPNVAELRMPEKLQNDLPKWAARQIATLAQEAWAANAAQRREQYEERCEIIRIETSNVLWNIDSAIEDTRNRIEMLQAAGDETSRRNLQVNFQPRLERLQERRQMVERGRDLRIHMLQESLRHINAVDVSTVELQSTAYIRLEIDPEPATPEEQEASPEGAKPAEFAEQHQSHGPNKPR